MTPTIRFTLLGTAWGMLVLSASLSGAGCNKRRSAQPCSQSISAIDCQSCCDKSGQGHTWFEDDCMCHDR